ncbi:MAG: hypothetical protein A3I68_05740 [Candidatus Melainabacteria bacterium RIFCSPLOWO2_02_FULL_35_15]|nr:MAG: hypothetical protein A3F80_00610 [Candidatus Melainabacteria bacterium RIFCSPLOWO2_12_FULL_35_11]OGI13871.1 MAG: hypothetical protein A3I68_05740 [Candidatus Melainabacteria bacterium RIFCSPLOWO2_02_FULL_35_15]
MAEFCKVCGIGLKAGNTVDYRPGSCRDCELERKKLYSGLSIDPGHSKSLKKSSKKKKNRKKTVSKLKQKKTNKKLTKKLKLKKQKLLKAKKLKTKKLAQLKKLTRIRAERKRKKLRQKIEKLRKLRTKKALKLKLQRKKQKERERKSREKLKQRIRKAKERERKLLRQERERLRKEKEKIRSLIRQEKERVRAEKRAEKERVRTEKQRIRLEKQQEKERLKKAKEAAKLALMQAREAARAAAQESRRLREEAKKPPIVSVVTKVKELLPPPDVKIIGISARDQISRMPQPTKVIDPKKPGTIAGGTSSTLLESATVIPAKAGLKEEKEILKQSSTAQHNETIQKEVEKLQKDTDPIIDRYNPYSQQVAGPNTPRPPSPTPWLAPSFSIVKGDFQETKQQEGQGISGGLSDEQVKDIIEKIKGEHKKKST